VGGQPVDRVHAGVFLIDWRRDFVEVGPRRQLAELFPWVVLLVLPELSPLDPEVVFLAAAAFAAAAFAAAAFAAAALDAAASAAALLAAVLLAAALAAAASLAAAAALLALAAAFAFATAFALADLRAVDAADTSVESADVSTVVPAAWACAATTVATPVADVPATTAPTTPTVARLSSRVRRWIGCGVDGSGRSADGSVGDMAVTLPSTASGAAQPTVKPSSSFDSAVCKP
jgi:hypothetical protein